MSQHLYSGMNIVVIRTGRFLDCVGLVAHALFPFFSQYYFNVTVSVPNQTADLHISLPIQVRIA